MSHQPQIRCEGSLEKTFENTDGRIGDGWPEVRPAFATVSDWRTQPKRLSRYIGSRRKARIGDLLNFRSRVETNGSLILCLVIYTLSIVTAVTLGAMSCLWSQEDTKIDAILRTFVGCSIEN